MAFKSYHVTALPNGSWELSHPEPIRLSGPRGLVARHVLALDSAATTYWSLETDAWLHLQNPTTAAHRWILFEQHEDEQLRLSRLLRINGMVAHGQTEILLTLSPLIVTTAPTPLCVDAPPGGRAWSEELALDGAPGRPHALWSWCERALHVGAAVLGGTRP